MALSLSAAAVCQCFALVSLCTSVADPNWIYISNSSDPNSTQQLYGVAFTLHAADKLTHTGPLDGENGWGMWLLYALTGVCYSGILISSSSFLFDFLGGGRTRPRLLAALHVFAAVLCLGALGVCGACFCVIIQKLLKGLSGRFWDGVAVGPGGAVLQAHLGESFFIAALALLFSGLAAGLSLREASRPAPGSGYAPIESRDSDSEVPPASEPGEECGDDGEVFS